MAAGREAIEAAILRGIIDPKILSEIGEAAAAEATTIMKMLYEEDAFAEQGLKLSGDALNNWKDNIWSIEDAKMRGMIIESFLSKTDYSTWGFMGRESGGYWKGFDFADDFSGTISSIKTLDPRLSSYAADDGYSAIKGYIDELYDLGEVTMADGQVVAKKILDVRVPAGTIGNVARDRLMNYINNTYNGTIGLVIKEF
ncbi:hypothetical protein [Acetivibrio clariflavus]|nr:hypothetical protein [Acetivibrio clariflavus]